MDENINNLFPQLLKNKDYNYWNRLRKNMPKCLFFENLHLENCNMSLFDLDNTSFKNCKIWNCKIENSILNNISFVSCAIVGLVIRSAVVNSAIFINSLIATLKFDKSSCDNLVFDSSSSISTIFFQKSVIKKSEFLCTKIEQFFFIDSHILNCVFDTWIWGIWLKEPKSEWENINFVNSTIGVVFGSAKKFKNISFDILIFLDLRTNEKGILKFSDENLRIISDYFMS